MLRSKKRENNYQQCFDDFCLRILKTAGSEQQKTRQNVDGNLFEDLEIGDAYPKESVIKTRLNLEADQSYITINPNP